MIRDQFKGSKMEKIVQEALNERKVVWPWPEIGIDEGSESLFKILKANGYKEWKNPNLKNHNYKSYRYLPEFVTGKVFFFHRISKFNYFRRIWTFKR